MHGLNEVSIIPTDVWGEVDLEEKRPVREQIEHNDQIVDIQYLDDNQEYPYIRFRSRTNINYQCKRCDYTFNRKDKLVAHFDRKTKCFDTSKQDKIERIANNTHVPIHYRDNKEYEYTEQLNGDGICYSCSRCIYNTNHLPSLKKHFDRKTKCFQVIKFDPNVITIEYIDNDENKKFHRVETNGCMQYHCDHCSYKSNIFNNLKRHFQRGKNPCWNGKQK
jgi:hypothetical protein